MCPSQPDWTPPVENSQIVLYTFCLVGNYQEMIQKKEQVLHKWSANYSAFQWQLFKACCKHVT